MDLGNTPHLNLSLFFTNALIINTDIPHRVERETVIVFIVKQIIKLNLDYYIHKAACILQIGKKRAKLP
jgi:hypothetical protein